MYSTSKYHGIFLKLILDDFLVKVGITLLEVTPSLRQLQLMNVRYYHHCVLSIWNRHARTTTWKSEFFEPLRHTHFKNSPENIVANQPQFQLTKRQ